MDDLVTDQVLAQRQRQLEGAVAEGDTSALAVHDPQREDIVRIWQRRGLAPMAALQERTSDWNSSRVSGRGGSGQEGASSAAPLRLRMSSAYTLGSRARARLGSRTSTPAGPMTTARDLRSIQR